MTDGVHLETVACNLCGADDTRLLFTGRDRMHGLPGHFSVVQCRQCGLIYLNPRPTAADIGRYYPADYEPFVAPLRVPRRRLAMLDYQYGFYKRLRAISALQPRGRLLDVGCGAGDWLAYARERGWEVQGVEVDGRAAAFCRERLGLPVLSGDLFSAAFPDARFDVVTLWNVLEHLHDPAAGLREMRRILRPDGLLVLAVPDAGSLDARLFGPAWVGYEVPRHLYTFTQATLERLLGQAGFHAVGRRCLESSYTVFFLSLRFWLQDRPRWRRLLSRLLRAERSAPLRLAAAPYFWLIDRLRKGPVVTTFARPDGAGRP